MLGHSFQYLTPRLRITPRDLSNTKLEKPNIIHFICSPSRASAIISDVKDVDGWHPITIYEPIPVRRLALTRIQCVTEMPKSKDRCIPEELPALRDVLEDISILRCEVALALLERQIDLDMVLHKPKRGRGTVDALDA